MELDKNQRFSSEEEVESFMLKFGEANNQLFVRKKSDPIKNDNSKLEAKSNSRKKLKLKRYRLMYECKFGKSTPSTSLGIREPR